MYYLSVFQEQFISKDTKDACKKSCQKIKKYIYKDPKKTDWKNKNLCMHKGLQFEKM